MADAGSRLQEVLIKIAKEQGYDDPEINVRPISSGGANYTSQLFAVTLSCPGKEDLNLFSKVARLAENIRSMSDMQVFEIEIMFYTTILSKFRDLETRYNISQEERLFLPTYYGGITDYSEELMVFDDFSTKGYQSFNRFKCFDWEYASTCVDVLAKLHALSVAYQKEDPRGYAEIIGKLKYNSPPESLEAFLSKSIAAAVEATDEIYREKVEIFLHNDMRKHTFTKFFSPERKFLLIHGDFRPSNILHKAREDGKLQVVPVDYQMIKQGNPVTDLVYFLISGSDEAFRAKHLQHFFNHYYETFCQSLRRLDIQPDGVYKESDFRDDVKEMLPFGLTLAAFALPIITVDEGRAPKPEDAVDFTSFNMEVSDQFSVRFNALVRDYVKMGIL